MPGRAAVPAPPRLAPYPTARQQAGGRGGLWADAGAVLDRCLQSVTRLGRGLIVSARSACPQLVLSREGGRRPSWLGRVHLPRSSYQRGGFQRHPSFRRFAWCWRGSCCSPAHRWTFTLTRSLPFAAALVHLISLPDGSAPDCRYREGSLPLLPPPSAFSLHLTNRSLKSLFSLFSHLELPQILLSALQTFRSPCPSLSTKEQRPHHPSLSAVL